MSIPADKNIDHQDNTSMNRKKYHLNSWEASGQKVSEYCKENDLAPSTLRSWAKSIPKPKSKFKQIKTPAMPQRLDEPPKLLVKLGDAMKLYFHSIDDVNSITKLLKELR